MADATIFPLISPHRLTAFLAASLILALTPGPGVLYILTRSLSQGYRAGLVSVGGVALGNLCNAVAASAGLTALLAVSSLLFTIVKYAGAAYLVCLGAITWLSASSVVRAETTDATRSGHFFRDGFIVALFNPKTLIFFGAFLPQFMNGQESSVFLAIMPGACFVAIAAATDAGYALLAGSLSPALGVNRRINRVSRRLAGATYIGLGIFAALDGESK
ncbi:hypothetical protein CHL67_07860 [Prosthecochloris sp. GSB1]|uniref:LysE family translocator n=1 Tax=Prosthecochloris sp. GSB1 TaxID=281093 RepID=UPI000B8CA762|nr:LysE family translocator [Prosthecochloris sp. GSB1]ASQ91707.1 hypothetical protein CHL67_07860 [Prosthecochloris sp. GSB1]